MFRGSSGHIKFDKNQPMEDFSWTPLRSTRLLLIYLVICLMCLLNLPTMLSFRVPANNMAQAMLVPDAMSTEVDLVPVLDMVPLDLLPPLSLPSEADLLQLLQGQSHQPCKIRNRKARCSEEG